MLVGTLYALINRSRVSTAITMAGVVVSHWVLDVVAHRPDMPITVSGAARLGFGLWNSLTGTIVVELAMFAVGAVLYVRQTRPRDRTGSVAFGALITFLLVVFFLNIFGPRVPFTS